MKGFKIARIFGIDIEIHRTWFIIFALIIWVFAGNYLPATTPGQSAVSYWLFGAAATILFFASLLFHELSHSLVARRFKIAIERITLFILGGVAQMKETTKSAKAEFFMAAAGPCASLFLAGFFWALRCLGPNTLPQLAVASFYYLALINVLLAVFNLLPAFPLDGGRIFRAILWWHWRDELRATKIAANSGKLFGMLMIVGGIFLFVFTLSFSGLWFAFIGWFLLSAAKGSYWQLATQKILSQAKVKEVMERVDWFKPEFSNPELLCRPEDSLKMVYERMVKMQKSMFFVRENGEIIGCITIASINRYIKERMK